MIILVGNLRMVQGFPIFKLIEMYTLVKFLLPSDAILADWPVKVRTHEMSLLMGVIGRLQQDF